MTPPPGRPIGAGELLDRSWDVIRRRFGALLAVSLPIQAATTALQELTPLGDPDIPTAWGLPALLPAMILFGLSQVGGAVIVSGELEGRRAGALAAWRRMLAASLAVVALQTATLLLLVIGLVLFIIPGLWFAVAAGLAPVVVAVERRGPFAAIARSARLVSRRWWRTATLLSLPVLLILPVGILAVILPEDPWTVWGLALAQAVLFTFGLVVPALVHHSYRGLESAIPRAEMAPAPFEITSASGSAAAQPGVTRTFRELEHAGWTEVARPYRTSFASLTGQAAEPLLDAVGAGPGTKLLDVASGPGVVAAAAAARKSIVTGIDFSATMVDEARRLHQGIEFREGDAAALPFADGTFDAVTINFGMLHFDDPERALAEALRVLRPGGRVAFTVWQPPEHAVTFGIVLAAVAQHGSADVPLPPGPAFFRFSDPDESARVLLEAGFVAPHTLQIPMTWRLGSGEEVFEAMRDATVRTRALLVGQTPAALEAIRRTVVEAAESYRRGGALELPMPALLATARRPDAPAA